MLHTPQTAMNVIMAAGLIDSSGSELPSPTTASVRAPDAAAVPLLALYLAVYPALGAGAWGVLREVVDNSPGARRRHSPPELCRISASVLRSFSAV